MSMSRKIYESDNKRNRSCVRSFPLAWINKNDNWYTNNIDNNNNKNSNDTKKSISIMSFRNKERTMIKNLSSSSFSSNDNDKYKDDDFPVKLQNIKKLSFDVEYEKQTSAVFLVFRDGTQPPKKGIELILEESENTNNKNNNNNNNNKILLTEFCGYVTNQMKVSAKKRPRHSAMIRLVVTRINECNHMISSDLPKVDQVLLLTTSQQAQPLAPAPLNQDCICNEIFAFCKSVVELYVHFVQKSKTGFFPFFGNGNNAKRTEAILIRLLEAIEDVKTRLLRLLSSSSSIPPGSGSSRSGGSSPLKQFGSRTYPQHSNSNGHLSYKSESDKPKPATDPVKVGYVSAHPPHKTLKYAVSELSLSTMGDVPMTSHTQHKPTVTPTATATATPTATPTATTGAITPTMATTPVLSEGKSLNELTSLEAETTTSTTTMEDKKKLFADNYTIGQELGEGTFAKVMEAKRRETGNPFAVKVVQKSKLTTEKISLLENEIKMLQIVNHRNLICMFEYYNEEEFHYLVFDFMGGGTLFDRIQTKSFYEEEQARQVASVLFEAIAHCHQKKVAHRDLNPDNILLEHHLSDTHVKIGGFALSKLAPDPMCLSTQCGTRYYVAPEMIEGMLYGTKADMWSLGIVTFVLLGGYLPFNSDDRDELNSKICNADVKFHPKYWKKVSLGAKNFIRNLLKSDPMKRMGAEEAQRHPWITGQPFE